MPNELEPIEDHIGGDTLVLPFAVPDEDTTTEDDWKDLTGATIRWALVDWDEHIVLSEADDGVTTSITDPVGGAFEVRIAAGTGEALNGTFEEWVRVETSSGDRQTWVGTFTVVEGVINET